MPKFWAHRDSNADWRIRNPLFYPVKLWALDTHHYAISIFSQEIHNALICSPAQLKRASPLLLARRDIQLSP